MSVKSGNTPRPASSTDAKSIKIGSYSPTIETSSQPLGTSPEAQKQSPNIQHPSSPPGTRLLADLWPSTDLVHQLGTQNRRNKTFKNLPVDGVADAVARALKLSSEGKEAFFACAEYLTQDSRTAANASGACAFWMDIDCGQDKAAAGKGYATVDDAEDALTRFCQDAGLPGPTFIIHSGGGLHVYWAVDGVISRETWQSYARKLKDLAKTCEFLADDSRTADIASVLRVPGTLNHKYSPHRPVVLKHASAELIEQSVMLDAIAGAHTRLCSAKSPGQSSNATTAANPTGNADAPKYGPPDLEKLSAALATLDPDCDEATWKLKRLAPLAIAARNHPELATALYELARSWSSGELSGKASKAWTTPGRTNGFTGEQVFDQVWKRFLQDTYTGKHATLGTIYHDAKEAGWIDPEDFQPIPDKPTSSKRVESAGGPDPLASIQRQFALINLNGRLWVLDGACLDAKPDQPAGKLALSNRSDGSLLISRAVIAQFPNENASKTARDFFTSPDTVCYRDVEFNPAGTTEGYLNLWIGPTATPQAGDWQLISDFLLDIICNGDGKAHQYLMRYLAHALQHPADKPGVVIVMLGGQGCGKGTFGRILRKIWGATYLQVHNMDAVTGNFNGSLERAFIVFMDEALFVGDRRTTDAFKSLVTEPVIHVNEKHQPARQIRSYHRYFVATNADHWKHTEKDDRRDFVLRISEERKGDHAYWRELHHAIENGTVEAMMQDLLEMDLSEFNVRDKPETRELLVQKLQSLDAIPRWWYDCLQAGSISDGGAWPEFIGTADAIEDIVELSGNKLFRKPAAIDLIRAMHKLCPSSHKKQRKTNSGRQRGLALPSLERSREEFERYIGGAIEW